MTRRIRVCSLLCSVLLAGFGAAQTANLVPKFAVEIPGHNGPPSYVTLATTGVSSLFYDGSLPHLPNPNPDSRQPSALRLEYTVEGNQVAIAATVFYGDFDHRTTPVSLEKLARETVGTYSGKLNDSVTLVDMEKFGLQPLTLRIVTAQPDALPPPPIAKSDAPSLQMEIVGQDRTFCTVAIRNLSIKAVVALSIGTSENGGHSSSQIAARTGKELIAPGATYRFQQGLPSSGKMINGTFVADPVPAPLTLQAVLFQDGSYEGDVEIAAEMAARPIGASVQAQRVERLVEAILADRESDDESKIKRIRAETARLSEDPDPQTLASVREKFAGLSDKSMDRVRFAIKISMNSGKQAVDLGLQEFERSRERPHSHALSLAEWWALTHKQ